MSDNTRRGMTVLINQGQRSNLSDVGSEMYLYRERTTALLRKYCTLSMELGRVPSLLGREFFRSKVTSYRMSSFEDVVIFVYDVERCLEKLDRLSQQLIARIAMQEYTYREASALIGYSERTIERRYPEALDKLTTILLNADLLRASSRYGQSGAVPKKTVRRVEACQEAQKGEVVVSS